MRKMQATPGERAEKARVGRGDIASEAREAQGDPSRTIWDTIGKAHGVLKRHPLIQTPERGLRITRHSRCLAPIRRNQILTSTPNLAEAEGPPRRFGGVLHAS